MWVDEFYEFFEDSFLDEALLVDRGGEVFEVYGGFEGFAQMADEFDIYVRFEKGGAYFFDHAIEGLEEY